MQRERKNFLHIFFSLCFWQIDTATCERTFFCIRAKWKNLFHPRLFSYAISKVMKILGNFIRCAFGLRFIRTRRSSEICEASRKVWTESKIFSNSFHCLCSESELLTELSPKKSSTFSVETRKIKYQFRQSQTIQ